MSCFFIVTSTYRSPEGPPLIPASPSPESLILSALSTPAGIFIAMVLLVLFLPEPEQILHGSFIVSPEPLHSGHVCCNVKKPC